jgi:hypothetical protein
VLTWAFVWYMVKTSSHSSMGHIIPMGCDVAIFYYIACAAGHT